MIWRAVDRLRDWGRALAVLGAAVLVGAVAFLLLRHDEGSNKTEVSAVDTAKLSELASSQGQDVYWAGPGGAARFEWSKTPDGRIYIRYLTGHAQAGDPRPSFLTVGTYPVGNGVKAIESVARSPGSRTFKVQGGAIALVNRNRPTSVYLAHPGSSYQIEVFDPDPRRALLLVRSGKIQPVP